MILNETNPNYGNGHTYYIFSHFSFFIYQSGDLYSKYHDVGLVKPHKIVTKKPLDLSKFSKGIIDCKDEIGIEEYKGYKCLSTYGLYFKKESEPRRILYNLVENEYVPKINGYYFKKFRNALFVFENYQEALNTYNKLYQYQKNSRKYGPKNVHISEINFKSGF